MKRRLVLLGPPASGKGTQAAMLADRFQIPAASTGAILREEQAKGTAIGREAAVWTGEGRYFPDELAMRVVSEWLGRVGSAAFILDGFPRTLGQAQSFDVELGRAGNPLDLVVHLALPEDEIRTRLLHRLTCPHCGMTVAGQTGEFELGSPCPRCESPLARRSDDTEETLKERLRQHHALTEPVLDYYRAASRLTEVNAAADKDRVFAGLCELMEEGSSR